MRGVQVLLLYVFIVCVRDCGFGKRDRAAGADCCPWVDVRLAQAKKKVKRHFAPHIRHSHTQHTIATITTTGRRARQTRCARKATETQQATQPRAPLSPHLSTPSIYETMATTTTMMKARVLLLLGSLCLLAPLAQAFLAPSLHMPTAAVTRRPAAMVAAGSSLRMQAAAATGMWGGGRRKRGRGFEEGRL